MPPQQRWIFIKNPWLKLAYWPGWVLSRAAFCRPDAVRQPGAVSAWPPCKWQTCGNSQKALGLGEMMGSRLRAGLIEVGVLMSLPGRPHLRQYHPNTHWCVLSTPRYLERKKAPRRSGGWLDCHGQLQLILFENSTCSICFLATHFALLCNWLAWLPQAN